MSAITHLEKLGFSIQQAHDFIFSNIEQPNVIYETAFNFGVTIEMISEISGFTTTDINGYFTSHGFEPNKLNDTHILINTDLGDLESLIDFNTHTGILSTDALGEKVKVLLDTPAFYEFTFDPVFDFQTNDNIYDAEELGVSHLSDVPATRESIESLFYGSLLNIFSKLDETELNQINLFPSDGNLEELQTLFLNAMSEIPVPAAWSDEELASLVTNEATDIINDYWGGELIGVLDHSFLGFLIT